MAVAEITPYEKLLRGLHKRHLEQRAPFDAIATRARAAYGSVLDVKLSVRAPTPHWNFFKSAIRMHRAKSIEGEPRVQAKGRNLVSSETAEFFQSKINPLFSSSSVTSILQSCANDATMFASGYAYVRDDASLEPLYWFNVWIDNALATPKDITLGRSILIRRLVAIEDFKAEWGDRLKELGFDLTEHDDDKGGKEDSLPRAGQIEGYEPIGIHVVDFAQLAEKRTGIVLDKNGSAYLPSELSNAGLNGVDDSLVEVFEHLVTDSDSPNGWKQVFKYQDKILSEEPLADWKTAPLIHGWFADYQGGQCYQSSLYVDIARTQAAYNYIDAKAMQSVSMFDHPVIVAMVGDEKGVENHYNTPGETMFENVKGSIRFLDSTPLPSHYFGLKIDYRRDLEQVASTPDVLQANEPKQAKSGVALQVLERNALTAFQLLIQSRDEWLRDIGRSMAHCVFQKEVDAAEKQHAVAMEGFNENPAMEELPPSEPEMIPALQGVTHEAIHKDLVLSFRVVPPTTIEDRIIQILESMRVIAESFPTYAEQDPVLILRMAGKVTENESLAEAMEEVIVARFQEQQEQQEAAKEEEAAAIEEEKEFDAGLEMRMEQEKAEIEVEKQADIVEDKSRAEAALAGSKERKGD